jgi:hypothetical protein
VAFRKTGFYEGAGRRIRTDDLLITNQLLYQLSYAGNKETEYLATDEHRFTLISKSCTKYSMPSNQSVFFLCKSVAKTSAPQEREREVTRSGSAVSSVLITVLR